MVGGTIGKTAKRSGHDTVARLPQITERTGLRPEQAEVFDSIASGAQGSVRGPHTILLHRPELAAPMDRLGTYVL
jgi:hypothetical protein